MHHHTHTPVPVPVCLAAVLLFVPHPLIKSKTLKDLEKSKIAENLDEDPIIGVEVAALSVRSSEDGELQDTEGDCSAVPNAGELLN